MKYQNERFVNEPDLYYGSKCGRYVHKHRQVIKIGNRGVNGYSRCTVQAEGGKPKRYYVHRFIWEVYNGLIPVGFVIDHHNDIRDDNRLCNLQLITPSENSKKAAKNRDYGFTKYNHQNERAV